MHQLRPATTDTYAETYASRRSLDQSADQLCGCNPVESERRNTVSRLSDLEIPDYVSSRNFHVDSQHGTISAPPSIGRENRDSAVVFARYGNLVGWKYIVITHREEDGRDGHLRLHPEDR